MTWRRTLVEAAILVAAAAVAGTVSNLLRSDESRLAWIGHYLPSSSRTLPTDTRLASTVLKVSPSQSETPKLASPPFSGKPSLSMPAPVAKAEQKETRETTNPEDLKSIAPPKDPGLLYLEVDGDVVLRMQRAGALFIDARRSSNYRDGHIPGARSIAVWEETAASKVEDLQKEGIPFDRVMVVYCSGGHCDDSARLSEKLALAGFYNLYVYIGGMPQWERNGWPVQKGALP